MTASRRAVFTISTVLAVAACGGNAPVATDPVDRETSDIGLEASSTTTTPRLPETTTTPLPGSTTSAEPAVASFQPIFGTYQVDDPERIGFLWVVDDETLMWATNESGEQIVFSTRFQGTSVLLTDPDCGHDVVGEYEFRQLDDGALVVVLLDDACPGRAGSLPGVYVDAG